jgi:hypothetical protein
MLKHLAPTILPLEVLKHVFLLGNLQDFLIIMKCKQKSVNFQKNATFCPLQYSEKTQTPLELSSQIVTF